jgi:type I restriction enzyme M protein
MLNPKEYEYVMDPSCGSAGFLLHAMEWAFPANSPEKQKERKHDYACKYLWGIDFEARAAKTSRALMLIAGDGHSNIFGPDVSSIEPRTWYKTKSGQYLMTELSKTKLLKVKPPARETFADDDKAWEYFNEMNFDIILANPPFAGEIKDKKILVNYELAKPALKRAKDKQAKEERDVLFIERILKMLRPGGRAAIVLPQGKFNNSSLAFIREWILRQARLLAVVGLHGNTFKPHTGTKTSVLVIQKYTEEQLAEIHKIQQEVQSSCPDYEDMICNILFEEKAVDQLKEGDKLARPITKTWTEDMTDDDTGEVVSIEKSEEVVEANTPITSANIEAIKELDIEKVYLQTDAEEIEEEKIPEAIFELLLEEFPEPEIAEVNEEAGEEDKEKKEEEKEEEDDAPLTLEEKLEAINEKIAELKSNMLKAKTKLAELDDEVEALELTQEQEIQIQKKAWTGTAKEFNQHIKPLKDANKAAVKALKDKQKETAKLLKAEIKGYQNAIPLAEEEKLLLTNKGKLQLLLKNPDSIEKLRNRFIDAEVAKRLDYPIFMAVSEEGGKDNSGNYVYLTNEQGIIEDAYGNPEIKQDLVNHHITRDDLLTKAKSLKEEECNIAEAFVKFAIEQKFDFWN